MNTDELRKEYEFQIVNLQFAVDGLQRKNERQAEEFQIKKDQLKSIVSKLEDEKEQLELENDLLTQESEDLREALESAVTHFYQEISFKSSELRDFYREKHPNLNWL